MRTEDELVGALRAAASTIGEEGDLLAAVARRRRRRTFRRAQAFAAAAAVVVLGVGARIVLSGGGEVDAITPTGHATPPTAAPSTGKGVPAEKLWPKAVFTMPTANADGWRYLPLTGLNATEVLLSAWGRFERSSTLEVYDSATRKTRVVTRVPRTPGLEGPIAQVAVTDGGNVIWIASGRKDTSKVREIWMAPLAGGQARLLGTLRGDRVDIDVITIGGDQVVWSERAGGVWRMPLAGGSPQRLPGGKGLHVISWPWAGDVPADLSTSNRNQTKLIDLARGTTYAVTVRAGTKGLRCGPTWCTGRDEKGSFVQRIDGTGVRHVGVFGTPTSLSLTPTFDRFVYLRDGVYDISTGQVASIGKRSSWMALGSSSGPSTVACWEGGKDAMRMLNLAAVPPAQ
ncbi:hypothetical protein ACIBI9_49125 [Nonomuraea sp. NPDC050451]|uniref:hypothetical protein n=1 Tax=Nonomuraea sp. NPDC050451 TaxID=3364364 RepID=UPI0037B22619